MMEKTCCRFVLDTKWGFALAEGWDEESHSESLCLPKMNKEVDQCDLVWDGKRVNLMIRFGDGASFCLNLVEEVPDFTRICYVLQNHMLFLEKGHA